MIRKEKIDKIFLTNIPSFYKIKLYNEINKKIRILVIFLYSNDSHRDNEKRNEDFFNEQISFDYIFLKSNNSFIQSLEIKSILKKYEYKELFISGWVYIQFWIASFFSKKNKNSVVVESSIHDSTTKGIQGAIKKLFLKRISKAYVPGTSNVRLMNGLNFKGPVVKTYGVGLYNRVGEIPERNISKIKNFIYVGRLAPVKNLKWLINEFNNLPQYQLTIVGFGPQEKELKEIAGENVIFIGAIDNKKLPDYYQGNHVFVLASLSEPWGLVVEEALNNGLPVLLSDKVGCAEEIVHQGKNGFTFTLNDSADFRKKIQLLSESKKYKKMQEYIRSIDFDKIEQKQIQVYLQ